SKVKEAILTREIVKKLEKFANDLKLVETDDAVVQSVIDSIAQFVQSVNPETAHLSAKSIADYDRVLASLHSLGPHLKELRARSEAELAASKSEADARVEAAIAKERFDSEVAGRKASQQLTEQFAAEKTELISKLQEELEAKLKQQADSLGRWWRRESRLVVDRERNRRLAKLDAALQQLKLLEDTLIDTSQEMAYVRKHRQLVCAVDALRNAICGPVSRPFVEELRHLRHIGEAFPVAQAVVGSLDPEVARRGLPTLNDLVARFEDVREEVRRAALVKEGAGIAGHMTSYVLSGLMFTKSGYVEGDDVEAVLSRTQFHLTRGELESAARELNQLDGWPKKIAMDWLHAVVSKLEFDQALKVLETEVLLETISHL
ncbi:MICOS complex subunit mic60, partial [Massospora cicadina]